MPSTSSANCRSGGQHGDDVRPHLLPESEVNLSQVFAGQQVGIRQVDEHLWLVTFMHYDLGYLDDETCRLEPIDNPFGPTVLPMSPAPRCSVGLMRLAG
jgi:hypothetical protein